MSTIKVILEKGKLGYDSINNIVKVGDGEHLWDELEPFNQTEIIDNLISSRTTAALSAKQGNVLNLLIENLRTDYQNSVNSLTSTIGNNYNTLNNRITSEVNTLNGKISTLTNTHNTDKTNLQNSITSNVNTLNERIDSEVRTINNRIVQVTDNLGTRLEILSTDLYRDLNDRINTEVNTLNNTITNTKSNVTDAYIAADEQVKADLVFQLTGVNYVLAGRLDSVIEHQRSDYEDLNTKITNLTTKQSSDISNTTSSLTQLINAVDARINNLVLTTSPMDNVTSAEIVDARLDSKGNRYDTLGGNIRNIHDSVIVLESDIDRLDTDKTVFAMITKSLLDSHYHMLKDLKLGSTVSALALKNLINDLSVSSDDRFTQINNELNSLRGIDSSVNSTLVNHQTLITNNKALFDEHVTNNDNLFDLIYNRINALSADNTSTGIALKQKFYEVEKHLISEALCNYLTSIEDKLPGYIRKILVNEYDNFLTVDLIRRMHDSLDRRNNIGQFELQVLANTMSMFISGVYNRLHNLDASVDENVKPRLVTLESILTPLQEDMLILQTQMDKVMSEEFPYINNQVDGAVVDYTESVRILKNLIEKSDHEMMDMKLSTSASVDALRSGLDSVKNDIKKIDNILGSASNLDETIEDINFLKNSISTLDSSITSINSAIEQLAEITELQDLSDRVSDNYADIQEILEVLPQLENSIENNRVNNLETVSNISKVLDKHEKNLIELTLSTTTAIDALRSKTDTISNNQLINTSNIKKILNELDYLNNQFDRDSVDNLESFNILNKLVNRLERELYDLKLNILVSSVALRSNYDTVHKNIDTIQEDIDEIAIYNHEANIDSQQVAHIVRHFMDQTKNKLSEFDEMIAKGISPTDFSSYTELSIPEPKLALVNFKASGMPTAKGVDLHGTMEFWDMNGAYFRKNVLMNAQGSSSMGFIKKNLAIDILNGNDIWDEDNTFSLRIGNWVPQDSFHLKAYYTDFFRGIGITSYKFYEDIQRSRGIQYDKPWKKALIDQSSITQYTKGFNDINDLKLQLDTGALCHPDGFPVIVYLNGEFYGIFSWQLKKHKDNMHMTKDVPEHIHIDGVLNTSTVFNGSINYTQFEIRNPKNLYCMDGTEYDGDAPKEIIDETSEFYTIAEDSKKIKTRKQTTAKVKHYLEDFSNHMVEIRNAYLNGNIDLSKELLETYFDIDNLIDYLIFSDIIKNSDGFSKNWQWTTYDGIKWFVNAYDLDMSFGGHFQGTQITNTMTGHINTSNYYPFFYIINYYNDQLKARYKELRINKIIDSDHIISYLESWTKRIGDDFYKQEYKKWPDSPCNNDNKINSTYWELVIDENNNPVKANSSNYNGTTEYQVDDICTYGITSVMGFYTFKCIKVSEGNVPIIAFRHRDNIYRVKKWIDIEIANMDKLYGYTEMNITEQIEYIYKWLTKLSADSLTSANILNSNFKNIENTFTNVDDYLYNLSLENLTSATALKD